MYSFDADNDIRDKCDLSSIEVKEIKNKNSFINFLNELNNRLDCMTNSLDKVIECVQKMTYEFDMLKFAEVYLLIDYECDEKKYYDSINIYFDGRDNSFSSGEIEPDYYD